MSDKSVRLFIPGAIVNPGSSGWTWLKRARVARGIRERVAQHVLAAVGRRPPWPVATPKLVTFTAHVHTRYDDDRLPYALTPYRDGVMDCGAFSVLSRIKTGKRAGQVAPGSGDSPARGHVFRYAQVVSRGKNAKRGVEITVALFGPQAQESA